MHPLARGSTFEDARPFLGSEDSLDDWLKHRAELHETVAVWELLRGKNEAFQAWRYKNVGSEPNAHVPDGAVSQSGRPNIDSIALPEFLLPWLDDLPTLGRKIGEHIITTTKRRVSDQLSIEFLRDEDNRFQMCPVPPTMLVAIWWQFFLAISEHKTYRDCEICHKPFEESPVTGRTNRRYCSNACRSKHRRQQRTRALVMHARGTPPDVIARELQCDAAAVRRWLSLDK
jgi:hypothetical protein